MRKRAAGSWMRGARGVGVAGLLAGAFLAAEAEAQARAQAQAQAPAQAVQVREARVQAEEARVQAQEARVQAQAARVQAEQARVQAQEARGQVQEARVRMEEARSRMEEVRVHMDTLRARELAGVRIISLDRPRIGISMEPDPERPGVLRVVEVIPGSGAIEAGIRVNDRILAVEGDPLPDDGAAAATALVERVGEHAVGDTLRLRIEREGEILELPVELTSPWPMVRMGGGEVPLATVFRGGERSAPPGAEIRLLAPRAQGLTPGELPAPGTRVLRLGEGERLPWVVESSALARTQGIRSTPMNPGLASYFGVETGALVLELGPRSPEGLREGDVITAVDGRGVETPADLARILGSYRSGETLTFRVWREGAAAQVEWTVP